MKKFVYSAVVALALCGTGARAAHSQSGAVRVGPAADEAVAPQPSGDEKKSAPAEKRSSPAENRPAATGDAQATRHEEPAAQPSVPVAREVGGSQRPTSKSRKQSKSQKPSQLPNSTASALAPATKSDPVAASDAPSKTGTDKNLPVGAPVKTASGAERASDSNKTPPPNSSAPANGNTGAPASANPNTSAPARPSPAPAAVSPAEIYRIGIGDVLDIRMLNGPDPRQSTLYTVVAGGVLDYPLLRDPLTVAGMTTDELAAQLIAEIRHRGLQQRPQVRVSVREYASHAVLVSGLVNDPGTKILQREAIPLYVVIAGAQAKPEAGRAVIVSRATGKVINVDLNDAAGLNTLVQSGDVVTLTVRPPEFFYIGGEIASPGQKDFHAGMTLTQALLASGGVTRQAGVRVRVARQGADGRLVSAEYNLTQIEAGAVPDPALQAGDRIEVPRRK